MNFLFLFSIGRVFHIRIVFSCIFLPTFDSSTSQRNHRRARNKEEAGILVFPFKLPNLTKVHRNSMAYIFRLHQRFLTKVWNIRRKSALLHMNSWTLRIDVGFNFETATKWRLHNAVACYWAWKWFLTFRQKCGLHLFLGSKWILTSFEVFPATSNLSQSMPKVWHQDWQIGQRTLLGIRRWLRREGRSSRIS